MRGGPSNDGIGEYEMHERLAALGYLFERQYRVDRWHIDLALPPLALELERGFSMPHDDCHYRSDSFAYKKYTRLLTLLERGWYVMTMRPPWIDGWDEAPQLVINYLKEIEAGTAPNYVSYQQYRHHGHWLKSVGTYEDCVLTVTNPWDNNPAPPRPAPGARLCRLKTCGSEAAFESPHCPDHTAIFAKREAEGLSPRPIAPSDSFGSTIRRQQEAPQPDTVEGLDLAVRYWLASISFLVGSTYLVVVICIVVRCRIGSSSFAPSGTGGGTTRRFVT